MLPTFHGWGFAMIRKWNLRQVGVVAPILLMCAIAGCARRRTIVAAPPPAPAAAARIANMPGATDARSSAPTRREVALVFKNGAGYTEVVTQLTKLLPVETYRLTLIDVESDNSQKVLNSLRGRAGLVVVAIGLPAARSARDRLNAPVLFAQIFNYQELLGSGKAVRGVTAMPPLDLQVQDWKKFDPKLQRVGLIVSPQHMDLITQAERAANSAAVTLKYEVSDSDRQTLYVFKRLAPQIDGLWLLPDDRILSPTVLHELLSYAAAHGVRVCVFSDSLLEWGALMSASPTPEDIARTVLRVLDDMMAEHTNDVPSLTPLSEFVVRVNIEVAARFGLSVPPSGSWVVRGERP